MVIKKCFHGNILNSCNLEAFTYQLDPYIGCQHLCYYCYGINNAKTNWEKEILIHQNLIEQLTEETISMKPQTIYIGMNSDPYQPLEKNSYQTRSVLKLLNEKQFSVCILTKSGLVVRDLDLLSKMSGSSVGVSLAFLKEDIRQLFEKNAPTNTDRIETLKKLKNAGIETYALICPVIPYITEVQSIIEIVEPYSDTIWIYKVQFKSEKDRNWQNIRNIINNKFPELAAQFKEVVFSNNHEHWNRIRNNLKKLKTEKKLTLN